MFSEMVVHSSVETDVAEADLPQLQALLTQTRSGVEALWDAATACIVELTAYVQTEDVRAAQEETVRLTEILRKWELEAEKMRVVAETAVKQIREELALRSDITLLGFHDGWQTGHDVAATTIAPEAIDVIAEIMAYDQKRASLQEELRQTQAQIIKIHQRIAVWQNGEPEEAPIGADREAAYMLAEVTAALGEAKKLLVSLEGRQNQLRLMSINATQRGVERLLELGEPADATLMDRISLADVQRQAHHDWPDEALATLEKEIRDKINQYTKARKSTRATFLAQTLAEHWDDDKFVELLTALTEGKNDTAAVLLLLAANHAKPRSGNINLPEDVVFSLLRGVGQLSQKSAPFDAMSLLAGLFLSSWETHDLSAQVELCLVFAGARLCGQYTLPDGILWQLPSEWPLAEMPVWSELWQSLLLDDEPIEIATQQEAGIYEQLVQDRHKIQETLTIQDGRFVRVSPIKSDRHRHMLGTFLFPQLKEYYDGAHFYEQEWGKANEYEKWGVFERFQKWVRGTLEDKQHVVEYLGTELEEDNDQLPSQPDHPTVPKKDLEVQLSEEGMEELYEVGLKDHGIREESVFIKRSALGLSLTVGKDLWAYIHSLLQVWDRELNQKEQIFYADLAEEFELVRPQTPLGQITLSEIGHMRSIKRIVLQVEERNQYIGDLLVQELLSQPVYALNLPRLIGFWAGNSFEWSGTLSALLRDVAYPAMVEEAVQELLQAQAPWPALLAAKNGDADTQKQIQQMQRQMQKEMEELETAVLKLNGLVPPDLQKQKELGRYRYVINLLEARRNQLQAKESEKTILFMERGRELRQKINEMDNAIFEIQAEVPQDVLTELDKGFHIARNAVRDPAMFAAVEEYIETIQFRINYRSWLGTGIHEATQRLVKVISSVEEESVSKDLTAEEMLNHFKSNNLRALGLDPEYAISSQVDTRIRILEDWLELKKLQTFFTGEMRTKESETIRHFYRYFSRMVTLKHRLNPQDQPLQFTDPTIYQHMDLVYPRANVLKERRLILITLPGNPPSPLTIAEFERTIVDNEWLDIGAYYAFVIVFIPHSAKEIKKRLERNFANQGLVIVDEPMLLNMCLSLKSSRNALGWFRPMLLNSLNIQDISIFQVNQACHPDTSIFVGRHNLLTRIANSNDNYAIYGGRRIGKTSILLAIQDRLEKQNVTTIFYSFEGKDSSDIGVANNLAAMLRLRDNINTVDDFSLAVQRKLDDEPDLRIVLLLDEVDRYIEHNHDRHRIVEIMRDLSDQNGGRFRIVMAGFMEFFNCLVGRGPYSDSNDPWRRMMNNDGPLGNLRAEDAEEIVKEGFLNILGWEFEHPMIPERIVQRTGGHPAFVQYFCKKLQELVSKRNDRAIRLEDIGVVFADSDHHSFITHVADTLKLNLKAVERFLIVWLAVLHNEVTIFTRQDIDEVFDGFELPLAELYRALERLDVTSVIKTKADGVYEFSVPDYTNILNRLGDTKHLDELEDKLKTYLHNSVSNKEPE